MVSVPYALKAGDAETLGGLPPSAFLRAAPAAAAASSSAPATSQVLVTTGVAGRPAPPRQKILQSRLREGR